MSLTFKKINLNKAFTLAETLVYIALLVSILFLIIDVSVFMSRRSTIAKAHFDVNSAAMTAFSRFSRDIKRATFVDLVGSTINASPGRLVLQLRKPDGSHDDIEFYLEDDKVKTSFNGTVLGDLTPDSVTISNLTFRLFLPPSPNTIAVRVEMTVAPDDVSLVPAINFYGTYVLRGSYLE
jgi:type II secretory pathway component PulJ